MKNKPYKMPIARAYKDIKLRESGISKPAIFLIRFLARPYLFFFIGWAKIILRGEQHLFDSFKRALSGKSRCIIAFRHPYGPEPQILSWFFLYKLKKYAAGSGIRFAHNPHALFVYGYEVLRWGGRAARFIMPKIGALPVHHSKMDNHGMARINKAIMDGPYPVALAPEGQVSYSAHSLPRLENGVVRLGFNAAEKLNAKFAEAGTASTGADGAAAAAISAGEEIPTVEILPVSIKFHYNKGSWKAMNKLIVKLEKLCGLYSRGTDKSPSGFKDRLTAIREYILKLNEDVYGITVSNSHVSGDSAASAENLTFNERLDLVMEKALESAERIMGLKNEGDFFFRIYRLRQVCWDRIYIPELDSFNDMTILEHNIMDINAGEAWYASRHQELVDFCWYFRVSVPEIDAGIDINAEYVQNLWDFASRSMGGAISDRKVIFPSRIIIHSSAPINLSNSLPSYHQDKKTAISKAMEDLEKGFLESIG